MTDHHTDYDPDYAPDHAPELPHDYDESYTQAMPAPAGNAAMLGADGSVAPETAPRPQRGPKGDALISPSSHYNGEQYVDNRVWRGRNEVTRFLTQEESATTQVKVGKDGRLQRADGRPLDTSSSGADEGFRSKGQEIFVMNQDHVLKAANDRDESAGGMARRSDQTTERFHHTSFERGGSIIGAGGLETDDRGQLRKVTDQSGHYMPKATATHNVLSQLQADGVRMIDDARDDVGDQTNRETRVQLAGKGAAATAVPEDLRYAVYAGEVPDANGTREMLASQFMQTQGNEQQIRMKDMAMFELRERAKKRGSDGKPGDQRLEALEAERLASVRQQYLDEQPRVRRLPGFRGDAAPG